MHISQAIIIDLSEALSAFGANVTTRLSFYYIWSYIGLDYLAEESGIIYSQYMWTNH